MYKIKKNDATIRKIWLFFYFFLLSILMLLGCGTNSPLVEEMELAYKFPAQNHEQRKNNVTQVIHRYFPSGMKVSEALKHIHENGFKIQEYRYNGTRLLPNSAVIPYSDESVKKNIQNRFKSNDVHYVAEKKYDWQVTISKRAVIVIESNGELILNSEGFIYIDGV